ncbi:transcriptional regulator with XRE-family HTH domain [Lentzea atacamensis]|uniref:Transcriptional regulator with XRE-family HTH domain n=1 Tax=Lentzea atacamensis TaxID=531938 RepID=A0A316HVE0_9PSEU|nr:helix-turn-helix transcriptional regulator [Lentzea atacamensis]PWK84576.1 transcriptional regulator with XRE-family HTH domain [Lentzea atacamensis]
MPLPLRGVDPARLTARRVELGLTCKELAAQVGVSPRMIFFYEEGRHTPTPLRLERLAAALDCETDVLTGTARGQETLVDLRYAAGLTLERVAELLRTSSAGRELRVTASKVSALEKGRPVRGRRWLDPDMTGQLVGPLAKAYGVPVRMIVDAWMRTRDGEQPPTLATRQKSKPSAKALTNWQALNERQQIYLGEIMREDRMTATEMWMRRVQRLPALRAQQWRALPLAVHAASSVVGYTRLQERLRRRGVHDPGAGSTVHALERRGLLVITEDTIEHPAGGTVGRVLVEITRRGRAAAQAGLGEPRNPEPAAHLLSEWLWGVVARVAAAEPAGLDDDQLAGRSLFFIGVGYRGKTGGRPSRGLVDSVPVMAPGGTHVAEYRWRLTRLGRRHVAEYLDIYRELYSHIDVTGLDGITDEQP